VKYLSIKTVLLSFLIGYGFGCIQTAYIVGRIVRRIDIRHHGSSNAGASNITQVIGWRYGVLTGVVDILKATFAVILTGYFFPGIPTLLYITGAAVLLGHIFPFYLQFKGGKGAASLVGMMIPIDIRIALIIALSIIVVTVITDYIAIGSMSMFTLLPITTYLFGYDTICIFIGIILCLMSFYLHRNNIKRIINHTEVGLRPTIKKR
jgi:glycerol-3-phosphate acyltransferase PlsY